MTPTARILSPDDASWLEDEFNRAWPWPREPGFVERVIAEQVHVVARSDDGAYMGHCRINRNSDHPPFRDAGVAEIQDLNVMPPFRRRGAASALLDLAESTIADFADVAGIGVGLYDDYGPAQRLYTSRGYVFDGIGAWTNHQPVRGGDTVVADDDLVLYLTKRLR